MDVLVLAILLLLSALFSGTETAYFSLRATEVHRLTDRGDRGGARVAALLGRAHALLSGLLIGNLLVNTATSVVATAICLRWFGQSGLAVAIPAVTIALLIVGEITPKLLALRHRERLALWMQGAMTAWLWLLRPLLTVIEAITGSLLRVFPWPRTGLQPLNTDELETACELAQEEGTLDETSGRFLVHLLQLEELEVREVMTPRPDVVALRREDTRAEIFAVARRAGFNRYPVLSRDTAVPVGFVHLKDLLWKDPARPLAGDLRTLIYAPETKDVAALLTEMRIGGTHLAAVVDEHGDFAGIVTLADCLQALIGPVGDIAGLGEPEISRIGERSWIVSGRLDLRELDEQCGVSLPPSREYVTVAGFVMARLGRIPQRGDQVRVAGAALTVVAMRGHAVLSLQVDRTPTERGEGAP